LSVPLVETGDEGTAVVVVAAVVVVVLVAEGMTDSPEPDTEVHLSPG
jgi:hypothetical protein